MKQMNEFEKWATDVIDGLPDPDPIPEETLNNPLRRALMSLDQHEGVSIERIDPKDWTGD